MNDQRAKRVNEEPTRKSTETSLSSHRTLLAHLAEASQERQAWTTQIFFEASQELVEQARRGQGTGRILVRGSTHTYTNFLDSIFFYYRENVRASEELSKAANDHE